MVPLWRKVQKQNFTRIQELLDFLEMDEGLRAQVMLQPRFPLNLPRRLAEKIAKNTLDDPLLRQFLPLLEETKTSVDFSDDPVGDKKVRNAPKLLHKYQGRGFLLTTSSCAMNCRFCFRQNFPYEKEEKSYETELKMLAKDSSLTEVILSGGDPLSLSNETLTYLFQRFNAMEHIKRVRFHTRFPIGIPERIDEPFLSLLNHSKLQTIFVIHVNHPRELDEDVLKALKSVQKLGVPVLNQCVLLQGVNGDRDTLVELFLKLVDGGIIPYYLHQLDRVRGALHFEVPEEKGLQLMEELRIALPGYALPQYVKEIAGEPSKIPVTSYLKF